MPKKQGVAKEEWYRQNQQVEDYDSNGPGNFDNEDNNDPTENVEAIAEVEREDVAELCARNSQYDAD